MLLRLGSATQRPIRNLILVYNEDLKEFLILIYIKEEQYEIVQKKKEGNHYSRLGARR